jgi:hypothetical protein
MVNPIPSSCAKVSFFPILEGTQKAAHFHKAAQDHFSERIYDSKMLLCCGIAKVSFITKKNEIEVFDFLTHNISFPYPIKKNIFSYFSSKFEKPKTTLKTLEKQQQTKRKNKKKIK